MWRINRDVSLPSLPYICPDSTPQPPPLRIHLELVCIFNNNIIINRNIEILIPTCFLHFDFFHFTHLADFSVWVGQAPRSLSFLFFSFLFFSFSFIVIRYLLFGMFYFLLGPFLILFFFCCSFFFFFFFSAIGSTAEENNSQVWSFTHVHIYMINP